MGNFNEKFIVKFTNDVTNITTTRRYAATSFDNVKHEYNQCMTI